MAIEEQLDLIKKGVSTWNEWRRKNAEAKIMPKIDLRNADLSKAILSEANLSGANLSNAVLGKANLSGADLHGAVLGGANLSRAYLRKANLNGANLRKANLSEANLIDAILNKANLDGADLSGANLSRAYLNDAILSEANLSGADLMRTILSGADLRKANLSRAYLNDAILSRANLSGADLSKAILSGANLSYEAYLRWTYHSETDLSGANLSKAILSEADLNGANLSWADLSGANLSKADLSGANMVQTNLNKANLTECRIYGISAWDLKLHGTIQKDLIITAKGDSTITVDNLEVAQFIYLLLRNEKIRDIIDTIGKKGVLILGRFTPDRKIVLDAIRKELHRQNYAPIVFDFEKPTDKDFTETIMTLAGMCRFIIVDITKPKSSPLELQATVPNYMIPFVPIIQEGEEPFSMFKDLANRYEWVMDTLVYDSVDNLVLKLEKAVIKPALKKHDDLMVKKAQGLRTRNINDY